MLIPRVLMDDGSEEEFGPGIVSLIPPGHDAWMVGHEPLVVVDIAGMENYAKKREVVFPKPSAGLLPAKGAAPMEPESAALAEGKHPAFGVKLRRSERMPLESQSVEARAEKVLGYILGNQAAWMAAIGLKTGLFQAISAGPERGIAEEDLSAVTGFHLSAVRAWCRSAYAFGFLEWEERSGYRLGLHMKEVLLRPDHPAHLGGQIEFYTSLNQTYQAYPQFLRSEQAEQRNSLDPWLLAALRKLTNPDAIMITEHVLLQAPKTLARLLDGGRILDVGAGEGDHIIHYARIYPRSQVIGLELDCSKAEIARKKLAGAFLEGTATIREGDINRLDEENTYDLITLNLTLHDVCTAEWCRDVLGRIFRALKPEGTLLLAEIPYPDSVREYRDGPFSQLLSGVQLHLTLAGCRMIGQRQLRLLMEEGRFENVRVATQPNPARFVLLGEKPANG